MSFVKQLDLRQRNIDLVIDTLVKTQEENGIHSNMTKVLFDPNSGQRINKFQRKRLEEKGVDLSRYKGSDCSKCNKCDSKKSNIERGVFVYGEDDLIDDDDDSRYICEFCTNIGFDGKYRPEECDMCEECEACNDYIHGECDGCGYSVLYNGQPYGSLDDSDVDTDSINERQRLLDELEQNDSMIHYPSGGFSVMKF